MEPRFSNSNNELHASRNTKPPVVPHKSLSKGGANLPTPLADPLRGLRTGLVWLNRLTTLIMVAAIVWDLMSGNYFAALVVGRQYAEFCRHCGSTSRLRLARQVILPVKLGAVVALLAAFVGLLLPDVSKVREAVNSVQSQNHLKQLGLAMLLHHDLLSKLPAANAANPNTPWSPHPVSWRVQLLPYLDRDDLYQRYRFDEPWDGPNNRELIPLMPDVYRLPTVEPNEVLMGHTFYRVFGSRPGELITAAFIDGQAGLRLSAFPDGTTDTLLIVEAAEAVPWTQPECLEFASGQKMPPLGKHYRGGFNGVLADGSTCFFPSRHSENSLRALVSINGGEPIQHE